MWNEVEKKFHQRCQERGRLMRMKGMGKWWILKLWSAFNSFELSQAEFFDFIPKKFSDIHKFTISTISMPNLLSKGYRKVVIMSKWVRHSISHTQKSCSDKKIDFIQVKL